MRGQEIPHIAVGLIFTDYHESAKNKGRKHNLIKKRGRRAKLPKNPSSLVTEQIPDRLAVDVESLANRINSKRLQRGLSFTGLGRLLGVDRTTVRDWEGGETTPQLSNLKRIFEWLDE